MRQDSDTPDKHARRILPLIMATLIFIIPFTATEVFFRIWRTPLDILALTGRHQLKGAQVGAGYYNDAFSAYRARPGIFSCSANVHKTVNSDGFISTPEIAVEKPTGTIRIVFLGESSTAGVGYCLGDTATWPWRTVDLLRNQLPNVKIDFINAALGGYTSFESFGRLWSRIRFFKPDILVVNHGWNEMYYFNKVNSIYKHRTSPKGAWNYDKSVEEMRIKLMEPKWFDYLISPSQFLSHLRVTWSTAESGEIGISQPMQTDFDHRGPEVFRTNLRLMRETARIIDAKLLVVKQPTLLSPALPEAERKRCRVEWHGFDYDAHLRAYHELYSVIDQEIDSNDIVDLTSLSGDPTLFGDHIHPREVGAKRIAEIMASSLLPAVKRFVPKNASQN